MAAIVPCVWMECQVLVLVSAEAAAERRAQSAERLHNTERLHNIDKLT